MTADPIQSAALDWPSRFRALHGRAPRVLHICNVANYAYVNARMMRRVGIDADVFDPDFYHIMASPEWLEAEVDGDYGQDFYPNWGAVNLNGYKRPEWFIQAPLHLGLNYLASRAKGRATSVKVLRKAIDYYRLALGADPERKKHFLFRTINGTGRLSTGLKAAARRLLNFAGRAGTPLPGTPGQIAAPVANQPAPGIPADFTYINAMAPLLKAALGSYDIVQGYTIAGMYPAAIGFKSYVAYELGTLRGLPFEDSAMGRICAWTYKAAPAVMITNIDCFDAADRLGIAKEKRFATLHAFDLDTAREYIRTYRPRRQPGDMPYFLAPARHHWKNGNLSWLKGNDVLIRGAGLARRGGYDFRIKFVTWGEEIELSKSLIREERMEDRVDWVSPQCRSRIWPMYADAVAILDQFRAPAIGGVSLESLALGKRLISGLDFEASKRFFKTPPPIMTASTAQEVADRISQVLDDREDDAGIGAKGQAWMQAEHSIERQLKDQFTIYQRLLAAD